MLRTTVRLRDTAATARRWSRGTLAFVEPVQQIAAVSWLPVVDAGRVDVAVQHKMRQDRSGQSRRAKVAALRVAQQRAERRRRLLLIGAVVLVATVAVVLTLVLSRPTPRPSATDVAPASGVGLPPWPLPSDPEPGMKAAGLVSNPMEGAVQHFHAHLDILVDGQGVTIPAGLGIDTRRGQIAELHTHNDYPGLLHVESGSSTATFTLGQLFVEWGVKLDATDLGGLHTTAGKQLTAYVDGQKVDGDPGRIQLANHQEIALVYGSGASSQVPATWDFAAANV